MSDEVPQEQETQVPEEKPADFSPGHESGKKRKLPWKPAAGFAAVAILFFAVGFFANSGGSSVTGQAIQGAADKNVIANDILGIITESIKLQGGSGNVTVVSVGEESGLYKITLSIDGTSTPFYATKDGKLFMQSYGQISDIKEQMAASANQQQPQAAAVPKADKPTVNLFVMAYCPFGLQMEKAMIPVMELLGNKTDFNINYVDYVMHGERELIQNNYQHCIEKEQPDKFVAYLKCFVQSDNHSKCIVEADVSSSKLDSCLTDIETEFNVTEIFKTSSDQYPSYPVDSELISRMGLRADGRFGSPTLVLNGKEISVSRSPEAVKQAICDAFNTPPEECNTQLSNSEESSGIGALGSTSGSGSSGGCST